MIRYLGSLLLVLPYAFTSPTASRGNKVVVLDYAKYNGHALAAGVTEFLGMRFAAPPINELRWREPQNPAQISGVQDASTVHHSVPS